ncbi:omptin family outer membrane protease [Klebsiella variicola]|nr:omptin family outer membrane protease [Klebsiella variicola]
MRLKLLAMALSAPVVLNALANTEPFAFTPEKVSTELSLGTLSGKTKERVYAPEEGGRKVSQLDWKYNNAAIIKGAINWDMTPWTTFSASGWSSMSHRGGSMTDTDWDRVDINEWTDHSQHPNTRLNYANEFDLNIKGWLLNDPDYRLGLMAGYLENRYSFNATGGTYIYSENGGFRNEMGSFSEGEKIIGYKQRFKIPYIGITGSYCYAGLELGGSFKYSGWARSSDNDEHYLTTTTFRDNVKNQNYYSVSANAGYYITPSAKLYIEGTWSRITNKKGSLSSYNYQNGKYQKHRDSSGIENYNLITTAGLKYTF